MMSLNIAKIAMNRQCGVDSEGGARLVRSAEKVLEQGRRVITHAEAETGTESGMEGKTQLPITADA